MTIPDPATPPVVPPPIGAPAPPDADAGVWLPRPPQTDAEVETQALRLVAEELRLQLAGPPAALDQVLRLYRAMARHQHPALAAAREPGWVVSAAGRAYLDAQERRSE